MKDSAKISDDDPDGISERLTKDIRTFDAVSGLGIHKSDLA